MLGHLLYQTVLSGNWGFGTFTGVFDPRTDESASITYNNILVRVRFCFHKSKTLVVSLFQKKNTIYSRLVEYIHLQYNILYRRYKKIRSAKRNIIRGIFTVPSVREELYLPFRPVMKKYVYRPVDVPSWKTNTIVPYRPVPSGFFSPTVPSRPAPPIVMFFIFTVPSCPVFIFFLSNEL